MQFHLHFIFSKTAKSIEGRPDFKRLLLDIQNGAKVDFVIVYKLSRFGRNAADILNSLELIQSYGVELICVEEGIDSSQTSGKLLISVLSAVAEIERENILEQTMNGRREKARQGLWNGGPAPYGYVLKENRLIVSEEEAKIVQMIFDKYVNTKIGYNGIARYLNYQGIKKTANCKAALDSWSGSFVKDVLDNPVYFGKIAYGRRVREKKKGSKYEYITVLADDFILVEGKHEAIVSEEIWNKAHQKRLRTGLKPKSKIGQERKHLLTGLLRCPKCGSLMYCNRHAWTNKDAQLRKNAIEEDVMTMENIYRLLLSFSQIYDKMDDIEKKNLLSYLIKRIDIYANDEGTMQVLKSIEFNFPIYKDGTFVRKILLDERVNVETMVVLRRNQGKNTPK